MRDFVTMLFCLFLMSALSGCIVSEDTMTWYLQEDGKLEMVIFHDNVHSSVEGAEKKKEEDKWLADFRAGKFEEQKSMARSGAKDVRSTLLRGTRPFSAVIHGTLPTVESLRAYFELKSDEGEGVTLKRDGKKRSLILRFAGRKDQKDNQKTEKSKGTDRDHFTFRFVPEAGKITGGKGFKIAEDKQSAMLDWVEFEKMHDNQPMIELSLNWEI